MPDAIAARAFTRWTTAVGTTALCGLVISGSIWAQVGSDAIIAGDSTLPPVPVPTENPITEAKRVLGKALFWDEQLSSDNTMACGSCHQPSVGGIDRAPAQHPGPDGQFNTPDDVLGALGVIRADADDAYTPDAIFGLAVQVTGRTSMPNLTSAYADELFWDGRASSEFVDPQTGETLITSGGALESQAVGPVLSDVEMAHEERDWDQVSAKLETAFPLVLAGDIPSDVAAAIAEHPSYPGLFEAAFGDREINAGRIAFAIATYQRTLVVDQTPWDAFMLGDDNALTPRQQQGWQVFQNSDCSSCHTPPMFTNNRFHNIGLRPNRQDPGRELVTGLVADRGKMKTPSLRNAGLRPALMHTGQFTQVDQVFAFYAGPGAPGNPNRDPILPSPVPPNLVGAVSDFITNGLTDPRVAAETFPFDRPTLYADQAPSNPTILDGAVAGTGGLVPRLIAICPPNLGNSGFKIGLDGALAGVGARVVMSSDAPVGGEVSPDAVIDELVTAGEGAGGGYATCHYPIPANASLDGAVLYLQWRIDDPAAPGGVARSDVARITLFGDIVEPDCPADWDGSGAVNAADVGAFLSDYFADIADGTLFADYDQNGVVNGADVGAFLTDYFISLGACA